MKTDRLPVSDLAGYAMTVIRDIACDILGRPTVISLGGYPFMGKTTLAYDISARWNYPAFVLPTESSIKSRRDRLELGYDGSSLDSHNLPVLLTAIEAIRSGRVARLPRYSWQAGDFSDFEENPILGECGLLVVDGSISTTAPVLPLVDAAFALKPAQHDVWLKMAISRDVADRNWNLIMAREQNVSKARTVDEQLVSFGTGPSEYLLIVSQ